MRLTTIMGGTRIFDAIQAHLENGALIAGTSAGAAVFSDTMIYEGKSEEGLFKGSVLSTSGFGFVNKIIFDTHFMARGRIGRLIQIVTSNPTCTGVGIGEDSGVILRETGLPRWWAPARLSLLMDAVSGRPISWISCRGNPLPWKMFEFIRWWMDMDTILRKDSFSNHRHCRYRSLYD